MTCCIVSKTVRVEVQIRDDLTGCEYTYFGACVADCEKYFLGLFCGNRKYTITYVDVK
jgi:hypothetical protein